MTDGEMPTEDEVYALCQDSVAGAQAMDRYEALVEALRSAGYNVIDTTTDEDECMQLMIAPVDEDMPARPERENEKPRV